MVWNDGFIPITPPESAEENRPPSNSPHFGEHQNGWEGFEFTSTQNRWLILGEVGRGSICLKFEFQVPNRWCGQLSWPHPTLIARV